MIEVFFVLHLSTEPRLSSLIPLHNPSPHRLEARILRHKRNENIILAASSIRRVTGTMAPSKDQTHKNPSFLFRGVQHAKSMSWPSSSSNNSVFSNIPNTHVKELNPNPSGMLCYSTYIAQEVYSFHAVSYFPFFKCSPSRSPLPARPR